MKSLAERILFNLIVAATATLAVGCFMFVRMYVTTYGGLQPGVRVDAPAGCAGVEWSNGPHFYAYADCGGL